MYCWTTLHVKDLSDSVRFYEKAVGLRVIREVQPRPGVKIAFLGFGDSDSETQVELIEDGKVPHVVGMTMGFTVDSLHGKMNYLKVLNIEPASEVIEPSPWISFFYIEDPDGVKIQFVAIKDKDEKSDFDF